ncbi:hypothetical protein BCR36DRAFT_353518 [Piromyces finnis]|uniref:SH3 domain-containing protein n=1 Tax=Piromyces finnis TaxID=1754191 RepID=A0A1Y1V996_9FUNG|nr:hypothetical protein BCR36DRAFT_353518 [Piromyces finnis]|eukprot:ORX49753.1 hypothetical protein BCR36DRAFT_353518 [Piromyces finnis]
MIIKHNIRKIILLLGTIVTKINSECIPLTNSQSCPGFSDFSIDTINGIFPLDANRIPHYTDVTSFDSYVISYSEFLAKSFSYDLAKGSNCNRNEMEAYSSSNLRYLKTLACNFILNSSKNSCIKPQKKVCKTVCKDFFESFQGLVNSYNTCLDSIAISKNITTHNNRCIKSTSNFSGDSNCVDFTNESNCGFRTINEARSYCGNAVNDSCCNSLNSNTQVENVVPNGGTQTTVQKPVVTGTSDSANIDNSTTNSNDQKESNPKDKGNSRLWIIISGICAVLVVGALIYFYKKGESLDKPNNSYYEENRMPAFQTMSENKGFNSSGFSSPPISSGFGMNSMNNSMNNGANNSMNKNINTDDVLINRNEMNNMNKVNDPMDDFSFSGDTKNFNFTSNVQANNDNNNGFSNAAIYAAPISAAGGAAVAAAAISNNNKEEEPKPQMVNMTNIQPPDSQNTNETPIIKIEDEEPKPQMVNMTNIQPPESQDRNESEQPPLNTNNENEEPKPQMVKMTEIPEPEIQQNRNTKFLSTYSEAPSNQRISSQYYGESETSYDFSSSKLNIPKLENKTFSMASSTMLSNRMSSSTDRELNSTPYRAVHTYEPQLNDELLLEINDIVEVVYIYDDGWVWGINTRTNESGACPMLCLEKADDSETDFSSIDERMKSTLSARESMLSRDSVPGRRDSRILKIDGINK